MRTPEQAQVALAEMANDELVQLLADVEIAIALRRDVTPHQVLRDSLECYAWPESEWPTVRARVEGWLSAAVPESSEQA